MTLGTPFPGVPAGWKRSLKTLMTMQIINSTSARTWQRVHCTVASVPACVICLRHQTLLSETRLKYKNLANYLQIHYINPPNPLRSGLSDKISCRWQIARRYSTLISLDILYSCRDHITRRRLGVSSRIVRPNILGAGKKPKSTSLSNWKGLRSVCSPVGQKMCMGGLWFNCLMQ